MTTSHTASSPTTHGTARTVPRSVFHSAWVLPVLILGEFAFVGIVPVALIAIGTIRRVRSRAVRWLAGATVVAYLVPFLIWALNPNRAESLSKDMNPAFAGIITVAAIALAVTAFRSRKH
jgi:hypothetical protein